MTTFFFTLFLFGAAISIMSIGVIFGQKSLRGSCGGAAIIGLNGEILSCETCPSRDKKSCEKNKEKLN